MTITVDFSTVPSPVDVVEKDIVEFLADISGLEANDTLAHSRVDSDACTSVSCNSAGGKYSGFSGSLGRVDKEANEVWSNVYTSPAGYIGCVVHITDLDTELYGLWGTTNEPITIVRNGSIVFQENISSTASRIRGFKKLASGRILAYGGYSPAFILYSDDDGATWETCFIGGSGSNIVYGIVEVQGIIVEFAPRAVLSLAVVGGNVVGEYPVDFIITLFDGATQVHYEQVIGNDEVEWYKDISTEEINSVTKMILQVTTWSHPNQVAKIAEFYTSVKATYDGDDIVSLGVLSERVLGDGTLPVGNISANEMDLELQNINIGGVDDPLFPDNPDSPLAHFIKMNRKITPYIGFTLPSGVDELVKLGTFWSEDWDVNEQSATVTVSARDRMELLRKAQYFGSDVFESSTLYSVLESVLNEAVTEIPMPDLRWSISEELRDYNIPWAWLPESNYFDTIRGIVEACMGQAYMSQNDVLIIEGPGALTD